MFREHGNHSDQKDIFMNGYNEMLKRIEPEYVICYSEPFKEMTGNIIYVDYELSSWQHMDDDIVRDSDIKRTYGIRPKIIFENSVCKGGGSAYGGEWRPKDKNAERFLGEPNTIKTNHVDNKKGGYDVEDKYDDEGKAIEERHYTDHGYPKDHSNPHDHVIDWSKGKPDLQPKENYWDGSIPDFKSYNFKNGVDVMSNYNPDEYKFETLGEFKIYLSSGANVGFEYNGVEYGIEGYNNNFDIWIYDKGGIADNLTLDEVMDYKLDGVKIKDLILTAEITERLW